MLLFKLTFLITIILIQNINSKEYEITVFSTHTNNTLSTNNGYKFSIVEAIGNWQDNLEDYGKSSLIFFIENSKKNSIKFRGLMELTNHRNEKIWFQVLRNSDLEEAGVGKMIVLSSTKKYIFLEDKVCSYAVNYYEDRSYLKIKCLIN